MQLDLNGYQELFQRSAEAAADFSWPAIAQATLNAYRTALAGSSAGKILFVQPFSLGSPGGGPRILRALLERAPFAWHSVCATPERPGAWPNETYLRSRPSWGRIERSRFAGNSQCHGTIFRARFFAGD